MSKCSCLSFIRRHISNMKDGQIFTTRDCLIYGKRSNVDNALFKCVRGGIIRRLANGVFTKHSHKFQPPSFGEIAMIKAKAFGKELHVHGADTAVKYQLVAKGNPEPTFYVDGSTSCFLYCGKYIHLKKASKKHMHMPHDGAGLAIRALWHTGRSKVNQDIIDKVAGLWNIRIEKDKIYRGKAWMPAWLGDYFLTEQYVGPFGPGKSNVSSNTTTSGTYPNI